MAASVPALAGLQSLTATPADAASRDASPSRFVPGSRGRAQMAGRIADAAMAHVQALLMDPAHADVVLVPRAPESEPIPERQHPDSSNPDGAGGRTPEALMDPAAPALSLTVDALTTPRETSDSPRVEAPSRTPAPTDGVPAHRALLASASPTFRAMFASGMQESAVGATVEVPYSRQVLACIVSFVYCASTRCVELITHATAMEVLDAACYYRLDALKEAAVDSVVELTTAENVLPVLAAAVRYGSDRLRDHCIGFVRQHNTDVLRSAYWGQLPLEVATLLVRETVIDSELNILKACILWCKLQLQQHNEGGGGSDDDSEKLRESLRAFLPYIDFTAMTMDEMEEVERLGCVPLEVLYRAFKSAALGGPPTSEPRQGGILLQWESPMGSPNTAGASGSGSPEIATHNNHATKQSPNFGPATIMAMNRFAAGRHYWHFSVFELRSKHDCLVGVCTKPGGGGSGGARGRAGSLSLPSGAAITDAAAGPAGHDDEMAVEIKYEPCCNTVTAIPSSGLRVTRSSECPESVLGPDHSCVIGVCVDFAEATVAFYDHTTKRLLYTVRAIAESEGSSDEAAASAASAAPGAVGKLPAPLYPCATLYHRANGGVVLSDTTTYLGEPPVAAATAARATAGGAVDSLHSTPKKAGASARGSAMVTPLTGASAGARQYAATPR